MEPPSKEWMTAPRLSKEYLEGVELFFRYVRANTHKLGGDDWYCCPCVKCQNFRGKKTLREIHTHLICDGIDTSYTTWIHHGELYPKSRVNVGASDVVCGQVDLVNDVSQDGDNAQKNVGVVHLDAVMKIIIKKMGKVMMVHQRMSSIRSCWKMQCNHYIPHVKLRIQNCQ